MSNRETRDSIEKKDAITYYNSSFTRVKRDFLHADGIPLIPHATESVFSAFSSDENACARAENRAAQRGSEGLG